MGRIEARSELDEEVGRAILGNHGVGQASVGGMGSVIMVPIPRQPTDRSSDKPAFLPPCEALLTRQRISVWIGVTPQTLDTMNGTGDYPRCGFRLRNKATGDPRGRMHGCNNKPVSRSDEPHENGKRECVGLSGSFSDRLIAEGEE